MKAYCRALAAVILVGVMPALALAEPVQLTSGSFSIGRPLIGTDAGAAALIWFPPPDFFGPATPEIVSQSWQVFDGYQSDLPGTNAPVLPLPPGPVPVGGTFSADTVSLRFSGGTFTIPSVFPPTDSEDLYTLTEPFTMTGHWTVDVPLGETLERFEADITARGHVRFVLGADRATGNSIVSQVIYEFEDVPPIPEPATLVLLGGAGAGLLARRRLRRQ